MVHLFKAQSLYFFFRLQLYHHTVRKCCFLIEFLNASTFHFQRRKLRQKPSVFNYYISVRPNYTLNLRHGNSVKYHYFSFFYIYVYIFFHSSSIADPLYSLDHLRESPQRDPNPKLNKAFINSRERILCKEYEAGGRGVLLWK